MLKIWSLLLIVKVFDKVVHADNSAILTSTYAKVAKWGGNAPSNGTNGSQGRADGGQRFYTQRSVLFSSRHLIEYFTYS